MESVTVDAHKHDRYLGREGYVQSLFPALSAQEREVLIQADLPWTKKSWAWFLCGSCWDLIPEDEEE